MRLKNSRSIAVLHVSVTLLQAGETCFKKPANLNGGACNKKDKCVGHRGSTFIVQKITKKKLDTKSLKVTVHELSQFESNDP